MSRALLVRLAPVLAAYWAAWAVLLGAWALARHLGV